LHGVGGCTIAEAKRNLSLAEAQRWFAYIRKRGSLNVGRRVESGFALLTTTYIKSKGGKADIYDFMPHEEEPVATDIRDLASIFGLKVEK
jgi:hypothetical protein